MPQLVILFLGSFFLIAGVVAAVGVKRLLIAALRRIMTNSILFRVNHGPAFNRPTKSQITGIGLNRFAVGSSINEKRVGRGVVLLVA